MKIVERFKNKEFNSLDRTLIDIGRGLLWYILFAMIVYCPVVIYKSVYSVTTEEYDFFFKNEPLSIFLEAVLFLATLLIIKWRKDKGYFKRIFSFSKPNAKLVLFTIASLVLAIVIDLLQYNKYECLYNAERFAKDWKTMAIAPEGFSNLPLFIAIISTSVITPIIEETIFRGILFKERKSGIVPAFVISTLFFYIGHSASAFQPHILILSLASCYTVYKSNSIWYGVAIHMLLNATMTILMFVSYY